MEILNYFPDRRLSELFDFLGFLSIYEDQSRRQAYYRLMEAQRSLFADALVVEAGAGLGDFSRRALELGARKVYAVEINRPMARLLRQQCAGEPRIRVVRRDIQDFSPPEGRADLLLHDLFGPLLYDESLFALEALPFEVGHFLPDQGRLKLAVIDARMRLDSVVNRQVLAQLNGVLVGDLFEKYEGPYPYEVCRWSAAQGLQGNRICLNSGDGDLLVFCLEIYHQDRLVCSARECTNWPLVWTPRAGDEFELTFRKRGIYCDPLFRWVR